MLACKLPLKTVFALLCNGGKNACATLAQGCSERMGLCKCTADPCYKNSSNERILIQKKINLFSYWEIDLKKQAKL